MHGDKDRLRNNLPIYLGIVLKDGCALGITAGDLEDELPSLVYDHVGGPDLDVDGIDLARLDWLHIGREVLAVRQPSLVLWVFVVNLAQADPEPSLDKRDSVASCTCVKDLLARGVDVSDCDEDIDVRLANGIFWCHRNIQVGDRVSGDLGLMFEWWSGELDELGLVQRAEGLVRQLLLLRSGLARRQALVRGEVVVCVLSAGKRPSSLLPLGVRLLLLGIIEADVALAQGYRDGRDLAWHAPADAVIALQEGIQKALLQLDLLMVIEGQVVAAGDEAQILEL